MSDKITSLADRVAARNKDGAASASKFFSVVRGEVAVSEAILDFRFRDGQRIALPYGSLQDVHFTPGDADDIDSKESITLDFTLYYFVTIEGKGLSALYDALTMRSVRWIREMGETPEDEEDGVLIASISATKMHDPNLTLAQLALERERLLPPQA